MLRIHLFLSVVFILGLCEESQTYENQQEENIEKYDELRARWNRLHPVTYPPLNEEEIGILAKYSNQEEETDHVPSIVEINGAGAATLIEGDIIPTKIEIAELEELLAENKKATSGMPSNRTKRVASFALHPNWPKDRPISFVIASNFSGYSKEHEEMIREALKNIEEHSCVSFQENGDEPGLIYLDSGSLRCASAIGDSRDRDVGGGHQFIDLSKGVGKYSCFRMNVVQHETMHALGFGHTQMRADRDDYMRVIMADVDPNAVRNFELLQPHEFNNHSLPYEYNSIMHYPSTDFSIDNKTPVLIPHKTDYIGSVGGKLGMTFNDWKVLNIRYKCEENCPDKNITCLNSGYQHPRECSRCACPLFYTGQYCEKEVAPLHVLPGEEVKLNFASVEKDGKRDESNFTKFEKEVHLIKAPEGRLIRITLNRIESHESKSCLRECTQSAVEIVDEDLTLVGKRFCCNNKTSTSFVSKTNVIGYQVYSMPGWGFNSDVTFSLEPTDEPEPATTGLPATEHLTTPQTEKATTEESVTEEQTTRPRPTELETTTTESTTVGNTAEPSTSGGSGTTQETGKQTEEPASETDAAALSTASYPATEGPSTLETRVPNTWTPAVEPITTDTATSGPNTDQSAVKEILDSIKSLLAQIGEKIDNLANSLGW